MWTFSKGLCILRSVTRIMVKTYNCSCKRNMYLWWCSNVYKRLQSFIWRFFLFCLSWVLLWYWQQCAAWGGEIWLHLTEMICPRAGNLIANFWKKSNPHPMPCLRWHDIDRCIINVKFIFRLPASSCVMASPQPLLKNIRYTGMHGWIGTAIWPIQGLSQPIGL